MLGQSEYRRFEELIYQLFAAYHVEGRREVRLASARVADFMAVWNQHEVPVEVKLYGGIVVFLVRVRQAAAAVDALRKEMGSRLAVLVTSSRLSPREKRAMTAYHPRVVVFDLVDIFFWAGIHLELLDEIRSFFESLVADDGAMRSDVRRALSAAQSRKTGDRTRDGFIRTLESVRDTPDDNDLNPNAEEGKGEELCVALKRIEPGRPDAARFEKVVENIVKYLFAENFSKWETQNTIDSGLRMDLCGKLFPRHRFWKDVVRDFNCRYVVFEFKNYSKAVSQEQVYSTEKYLLRDALRTIAIVISTNGADRGAQEASKGALREAGKVIVHLDVDDLCEMLRERDSGGDPELVLERRLDSMLMSLAR